MQELAWASGSSPGLSDTRVSDRTFDLPDNGLGLKSGLILLVNYRAEATSLRLRFARTVKNLIHHLDRRDLRPNKVGLPRRWHA